MNGAKRLKGWKPVEKMIEEWLIIAEHEQSMIDQYESEEQYSSSYSSCESASSSPRLPHEPTVRNIYNQGQLELQVMMHSNVVIGDSRQELMHEAHPSPAYNFAAPNYLLEYHDSYSDNFMGGCNDPPAAWYYTGFENYNSSPENFY